MEGSFEPRLIDEKDAREIVKASGLETKWDDEAVCEKINNAGCYYATHLSLSDNYRFRGVAVELAKLSAGIKKTLAILSQPKIFDAVYEDLGDTVSVDDLRKLSVVVEKKLEARVRNDRRGEQTKLFDHSPFEYLIGLHLSKSFEQIFEREPRCSISRADGQADGPFVRFCTESLEKLGIDNGGKAYKKGAIAEALEKVRASRTC